MRFSLEHLRHPQNSERLAAWLLLLTIAAAYGNALFGAFQLDDYKVIVDYPVVHSLSAWWRDVGHGLRPLLKLTYTLNWISGMGSAGFHLVNLSLHFMAAWLTYRLALRILPQQQGAALAAALLFAAHPAASEAAFILSMICFSVQRQVLRFIRLPVRILTKYSNTVLGKTTQADHCVTQSLPPHQDHRWVLTSLPPALLHS